MNECPHTETLRKYLQDQLPDVEAAAIEEHVERCGRCEIALEDLAAAPPDMLMLLGPSQQDIDTIAASETARHVNPVATTSNYVHFLPLAKGGLGEVWEASDEDFQRRVAVKFIQERVSHDPGSHKRFIREAEITGALEHPGIAPVYGMGKFEDGRPYYVMRYIRGLTLKDSIGQLHGWAGEPIDLAGKNQELRQLLRRFVDVCNTMAFAHSRGVVHRDLKPDNIMLGKYGETIVVDWGLAKPVGTSDDSDEETLRPPSDSGAAETEMGIGTPQYMSPEQSRHGQEIATPASDIYSLGATLYCLLVGKPPLPSPREIGLAEVIDRVRAGDLPPPQRVNSSVPRPLEAICLKALSLKPEQRYETCRQLADDLESWMGDEPLPAYRDRLSERFARWTRKHRTLAASLAVLLSTAVVALAVGLVVVRQEQSKTEDQRDAAEAARDHADLARSAAERSAQVAESERQLADGLRVLNQTMVSDIVFAMEPALTDLPGAQEIRQRLLATAIQRLEDSSDTLLAELSSDHARVQAHLSMGDLLTSFGGAGGAGATKLAHDKYQTAFEIAQKASAEQPQDVQAQRDLADVCVKLGDNSHDQGDAQAAYDLYLQCRDILQALLEADPSAQQDRRAMAVVLNRLGDVLLVLQGYSVEEALGSYQEALRTTTELVAADPDDDQLQHDLAVSYIKVGDAQRKTQEFEAALANYERAMEIRRRLADKHPESLTQQRFLSVTFNKIGAARLQLEDIDGARTAFAGGLRPIEKLVELDPQNKQFLRDLSVSYNKFGETLLAMRDATAARDTYQKAFEIRRQLADEDPENASAQRDLMASFNNLGDVSLQIGEPQAALESFRAGIAIAQELVNRDPQDDRARTDLSVSHSRVGDAQSLLKDYAAARQAYEACLEVRRKLADERPDDVELQTNLFPIYDKLGVVVRLLDDSAAAVSLYEAALELLDRLAEKGIDRFEKYRDHFQKHLDAARQETSTSAN